MEKAGGLLLARSSSLGRWGRLAGWILLVSLVATSAAVFTQPEIAGWYSTLRKPSFTPPNAVFGPTWTLLYAMMAVAIWMVTEKGGSKENVLAIGIFLAQLTANFLWSLIFFNLHRIGIALLDIGILWILVAATIVVFWQRSRWAAGSTLFVSRLDQFCESSQCHPISTQLKTLFLGILGRIVWGYLSGFADPFSSHTRQPIPQVMSHHIGKLFNRATTSGCSSETLVFSPGSCLRL